MSKPKKRKTISILEDDDDDEPVVVETKAPTETKSTTTSLVRVVPGTHRWHDCPVALERSNPSLCTITSRTNVIIATIGKDSTYKQDGHIAIVNPKVKVYHFWMKPKSNLATKALHYIAYPDHDGYIHLQLTGDTLKANGNPMLLSTCHMTGTCPTLPRFDFNDRLYIDTMKFMDSINLISLSSTAFLMASL